VGAGVGELVQSTKLFVDVVIGVDMGAPAPRIDVADELLDEWIIACRPTT